MTGTGPSEPEEIVHGVSNQDYGFIYLHDDRNLIWILKFSTKFIRKLTPSSEVSTFGLLGDGVDFPISTDLPTSNHI